MGLCTNTKEDRYINILYAADNNYAPILSVSISSLLEHSYNSDLINIFIIDDGILEQNKNILVDIVAKYNSKLFFSSKYDFSEFSKFNFNIDRGSLTQYARLFIEHIFPNSCERVLYLDCDTLILSDLEEFYYSKLSNCAIGGVVDAFSKWHWKAHNLEVNDIYINSGVILIDLNKWKELKIENLFKNEIARKKGRFLQGDQGLISSTLSGNIKKLPVNYNVVSYLFDFSVSEMKLYRKPYGYYSDLEIQDATLNPNIIHFTSCFASLRPWETLKSDHPYAAIWRKYYLDNGYHINDKKAKTSKLVYDLFPHRISLTLLGIVHAYIKPIIWIIKYKYVSIRNKLILQDNKT